MDRRVHVSEVPLIGGDLTAGVKVMRPQKEFQLFFAKVLIDQRQGRDMEGEIPGGIPRIFPFVRHRDHVRVDHVSPAVVADGPLIRFVRLNAVLFEPPTDVIEKELLGPEHPGQSLPHDNWPHPGSTREE